MWAQLLNKFNVGIGKENKTVTVNSPDTAQ